ncbi:hypothetical protein Csa_021942 [Cucumis sativus]|uniref:Uncharacterized protein n=1 Tax=Cucumis sativus TaxID=3659 RepID=A0A0A0LPZ4_CUCSA|nr:hypothetical protein Csa_021942 [Cucumis sativus]
MSRDHYNNYSPHSSLTCLPLSPYFTLSPSFDLRFSLCIRQGIDGDGTFSGYMRNMATTPLSKIDRSWQLAH